MGIISILFVKCSDHVVIDPNGHVNATECTKTVSDQRHAFKDANFIKNISFLIPQVSFNCSCLPGYTGRLCENEIDYCETANCQNGATCKSSVKLLDYNCECVNGYDGKSATS